MSRIDSEANLQQQIDETYPPDTVTYCPNSGYLQNEITAVLKALVGLDTTQANFVIGRVQDAVWRAIGDSQQCANIGSPSLLQPSPRVILGEPIE